MPATCLPMTPLARYGVQGESLLFQQRSVEDYIYASGPDWIGLTLNLSLSAMAYIHNALSLIYTFLLSFTTCLVLLIYPCSPYYGSRRR